MPKIPRNHFSPKRIYVSESERRKRYIVLVHFLAQRLDSMVFLEIFQTEWYWMAKIRISNYTFPQI